MTDRQKFMPVQRVTNRLFSAWFRLTKGRAKVKGVPTCVLHTVGAKTCRPRATPLLCLALDDGEFALVGSNGGDDRDPGWVHNLRAQPEVELEHLTTRIPMTATVASAKRRAELWPRLVQLFPPFADYQSKTDRDIPVIVLSPRRA